MFSSLSYPSNRFRENLLRIIYIEADEAPVPPENFWIYTISNVFSNRLLEVSSPPKKTASQRPIETRGKYFVFNTHALNPRKQDSKRREPKLHNPEPWRGKEQKKESPRRISLFFPSKEFVHRSLTISKIRTL